MRTLSEVRARIDAIDEEIRRLLMERLDCSRDAAIAKAAEGQSSTLQSSREREMLERLGAPVPEERRAEYLAVVKKIVATSRMYQYELRFDWNPEYREKLFSLVPAPEHSSRIVCRVVTAPRADAAWPMLAVADDYGVEVESIDREEPDDSGQLPRRVVFRADIASEPVKKMLFQLSEEWPGFQVLEYR